MCILSYTIQWCYPKYCLSSCHKNKILKNWFLLNKIDYFDNNWLTLSSRGLKSLCKFEKCKNFAKNLHREKKIFTQFLHILHIFLQIFLQKILQIFLHKFLHNFYTKFTQYLHNLYTLSLSSCRLKSLFKF